MSAWTQMQEAMTEARKQLAAADTYTDDMARMLHGRLPRANTNTLVQLKRELSHFNSRTGKWKQ